MLAIKEMSEHMYCALALCQELCGVQHMDSHLIIRFGGRDHFIGGETVTKRLRTFNQRYAALKWQSWDSDPTLREQRPRAALPSFTQGAWCWAPTHGLTGEQQEVFSSSSNCLLVHVLPGEGGWTLEGWLQSSRPGLAPPDWGCARGRQTGATQPTELSLAGGATLQIYLVPACGQ